MLLTTFRAMNSMTSEDRKSTRLNSSHLVISYAVFCLKKKNNNMINFGAHRTPLNVVLSVYNPNGYRLDPQWLIYRVQVDSTPRANGTHVNRFARLCK